MLAGVLFDLLDSPLGELLLIGDERVLRGISMRGQAHAPAREAYWRRSRTAFARAERQLAEYFAGERWRFDLALAMEGSPFTLAVWRALAEIPFGQTRTYAQIARAVGRPGAFRAVGLANGRNPFAIVLPCHRVIGSDGSLTGYGGGLERKRWLLAHEAGMAGEAPVASRAAVADGAPAAADEAPPDRLRAPTRPSAAAAVATPPSARFSSPAPL